MIDDQTNAGSCTSQEPLPILYQDEHYVAVHKPAGLLVHRSSLDSLETRFVVQTLRNQLGRRVYPVHRLDKATQGVLVLALDSDAAARLQAIFQVSSVEKRYLAVVRGHLCGDNVVDHPLRDINDARSGRRLHREREAVTRIRGRDTIELPFAVRPYPSCRYSLVDCRPETGRRHQIRRHLKHLRHPIVGDAKYGDGHHNRLFRDRLGIAGLLLAATHLAFENPFGGDRVAIEAPIDSPLREALLLPQWNHGAAAALG